MRTRSLLVVALAALAVVSAAVPGHAQEAVRRVTLDEALRLFAENNLELRLARADAAEAAGVARQAAAFPNPAAAATHESLGGSGASYSETYFNVSQRLEWPGQRSARREAAGSAADAARARLSADRARLVFEVKRAFVRAAAAEERLSTLRTVTEVFRDAAASGSVRFASGDLSGYDLRRLKVERARYENALAAAELDLGIARRELATLIVPGEPHAEVAPAAPPSGEPDRLTLEEALRVGRERRPEIAAARADVEAARAAVSLARRERIPDPVLTGGYKTQSDGLDGAFFGISVPVPLFDRGGGQIDAAAARVRGAEARLALTERHVENDIRRAYERFASLEHRMDLVGAQLLSETDDLLDIARLSYGEGAMTLVALLDAADAFRDARVTGSQLVADYWVSYYDLERAIGLAQEEPGEGMRP